EVIVRVACIFVAHERRFQMFLSDFVLAASIKGQAQTDVRRRETGIALQSLEVSRPRFTFFALLVESQPFNVALFGAGDIFWIGNRPRGWFEVRIVINRRIRSITKQYTAIFAFESQN